MDDSMEIDPIDGGPLISKVNSAAAAASVSSYPNHVNDITTCNNNPNAVTAGMQSLIMKPYITYPPVYYDPATSNVTTSIDSNNNNNNNNNNEISINESEMVKITLSITETKMYIDQLRSEDMTLRIQAAQFIDPIAMTLGCERTRTELIPFLIDGVDDEDEVLLAVATSLGKMKIMTTIGGFQYLNTTLLKLLELLLSIEEITVRDAAIIASRAILQQITTPITTVTLSSLQQQQQNSNKSAVNDPVETSLTEQQQYQQQAFHDYAAMVRRLATKEWFTARISASILIATSSFYCACDTELAYQLLLLYANLCRDDTSMVRRIAAQQLGIMVRNVVQVFGRERALQNTSTNENNNHVVPQDSSTSGIVLRICIPLYEEIASPDQPDSVRLQTTENCVVFGRVMSDLLLQLPNGTNANNNTTIKPPSKSLQFLHEDEIQLLRRILPLIVATVDDRSWRVRWTAAAKFAQVIMAYDTLSSSLSTITERNKNMNNDNALFIMDTLIPAYEKLLQDPEAEVRTAATFNLAQVAHCQSRVLLVSNAPHSSTNNHQRPDGNLNNNINTSSTSGGVHHLAVASMAGTSNTMNHSNSLQYQQQQQRVSVAERLVKRITSLTEDDSEHVRAALAMVATELAPVLGKDATITYLVPPVLLLLRDAASEVRLNLMSSLSSLNEVIGVDLLSQSLLPAILDLAQDGKWRIRLAIIQHIPLLAEQLGREFFTERLTPLCVGWLGDDIASIRHAAAYNLMELTKLFGTEWAVENLLPPIVQIREHESYLRRLTALKACSMMATAMDADSARVHLLPILVGMAADVVPNIRFNVAKELRAIAAVCGSNAYEPLIMPILNMLAEDDDRDVRFYAELSLNALDEEYATITK